MAEVAMCGFFSEWLCLVFLLDISCLSGGVGHSDLCKGMPPPSFDVILSPDVVEKCAPDFSVGAWPVDGWKIFGSTLEDMKPGTAELGVESETMERRFEVASQLEE